MVKRRIQAVGIVFALVMAGVAAYVVLKPDTSPAPATKKAIAAVAVDVLGIEPSSYNVDPRYGVAEPLGVEVNWRPDGASDSHYLHLQVEQAEDELTCPEEVYHCDIWGIDGGEIQLSWQEEAPESDPGILILTYATGEEHRSVTYAGQVLVGDPREQTDLPVSVDEFVGLVTDHRFSTTTTQEMVDADLAKWPKRDDVGDPVATTPEVVAVWTMQTIGDPRVAGPVDASSYGADAVGAELRFKDRTTTVVIVPHDSPNVPTCKPGWHCNQMKDRGYGFRTTTGWKPGEARIFVEYDDRTVFATVESDRIDKYPKPAWKYEGVGWDAESLEDPVSPFVLTTTRQVAEAAEELPWFQE